MKKLSFYVSRLSSLKLTAAILVAFLLLLFWGVLAQVNAESAGLPASVAVDRFFDSYFIWILGLVPLPAFKGLAVLAAVNVFASLIFRMPRGWKSVGLWLMHIALLILLIGGVVGSEIKREYNGYRDISVENTPVEFFTVDDSLKVTSIVVPENHFAYSVHYRGRVEGVMGKTVDLYKATYNPLHFAPYAFMVLFLLGAVLHYVVRVRTSRVTAGRVVAKIVPMVMLFSLAFPLDVRASEEEAVLWTARHPDAPVLVDSVVRPFNSFARGFLDDLKGRVTDAEFIVGSIEHIPESADTLALFKVLRSDVLEALRLPSDLRYVSYAKLAPSRDLLKLYASRDDNHPATVEMRRLYSNVLRYESVKNGTAFTVVEEHSSMYTAVDKERLAIEVFYHKANFALWGFVIAFMACLLASINQLFKSRKLDVGANGLCMASTVVLTVMLLLRAYVAMRPPMSNLYEIVLLVALLLMAFESGAFLFCKNRTYVLIVPVTLMAAALLFFAKFVLEVGDTFQPIPAVLNSSVFLTVHVFTIALGFAGMILSGVVSHLVLFRGSAALPSAEQPKGSPLYSLMYATLVFGAVFTIIGTLLGGVWADYAWGRFWGFDPKECGALFVILWAMLLFHLRAGRIISARGFALLNCFNVIVTFLCWFGVNLLGVGLHSYGFQSGSVVWLAAFVVVDLMVIAYLRYRKF